VTRQYDRALVDQDGIGEAEPLDAGGDLADLLAGMGARVPACRFQGAGGRYPI
jgi:hypothetical protein